MQQSTCRGFENLPPELLLAIAEKLPADSRLVLSQTCSAFHNIIQSSQSTKCSIKTFNPSTFLDYLAAIARDLPDTWVCDKCMALHAADRQDTPQSPLTKNCPRTPMHRANGQRLCWPHHRHVQLALKYTRLGVRDPERRRHLAELLDPVFASHPPPDIEDSWTARVTCSSRGKVVNGRFLLKYTWHWDAASEPIEYLSRGPGGYLVICNHQYLPGFLTAYIFQHVKQPGEEEATKLLSRGLRVLAEIVVRKATRESLLDDQRGMELTESCSECPTDFSVCVGEDGFWLSAWYDLGPEGSPFDEAWTSHRIGEPYGIVSDRLREGYVPGRIRRLYQQTAHQDIDDEFE